MQLTFSKVVFSVHVQGLWLEDNSVSRIKFSSGLKFIGNWNKVEKFIEIQSEQQQRNNSSGPIQLGLC